MSPMQRYVLHFNDLLTTPIPPEPIRLQFLLRDEPQCGGIDPVVLLRRLRPIEEQMPKIGSAQSASQRSPYLSTAVVGFPPDQPLGDWTSEAGPAGSGVEFVRRAEQRIAADHIDINAVTEFVPILILIRGL
ncbi:hypothetical protein D3C75_713040 [compost metagenome]